MLQLYIIATFLFQLTNKQSNYRNDQKVRICNPTELFVEIFRQKVDQGIFSRHDFIFFTLLKLVFLLQLFIAGISTDNY